MKFTAGRPMPVVLGGAVFLALFTVLATWFARSTSATFDEPGFMVAGYSYLHPGPDINTTNLRLAQLWIGLPLLIQKPKIPDNVLTRSGMIVREDVQLGREFL